MRVFVFILIPFLFISVAVKSQISPNHYLVSFKDKPGSKYSVNKPLEFLSQRAIDRRNRYKILFNETDLPVNQSYVDGLKSLGLKIVNVSKWTNSVSIYTTDTLLMDTLMKRLDYIASTGIQKKSSGIVQKNMVQKSSVNKYGIQSVDSVIAQKYGQSFSQISMHNGHLLHQEGYQGQGMHVAIIDGGFYKVNELAAFDSIRINGQILGTRDFVDGDREVYDASDHGMKVLSTMAGNIPGQLLGTAPKAKYWLLRSEQTASEFMIEEHNWIVAAEFADSAGVDLINSSLGYTVFDDVKNNHSYNDLDGNTALSTIGADIAASKGILVVNSAGNEGAGNWKYIGAPADADSILTVGAVMYDGKLAYFSSQGPTYDQRIKPDVCAIGLSPVVSGTNGIISYASGTSFSTPIMAGLVTCLWQAHPELNNMEIIELVRRCSNQYNLPDNSYGYGLPDIYAAHIYLKSSGFLNPPAQGIMNVFPNPFKNEFYVEYLCPKLQVPYNMQMQLFNIQGKLLKTKDFSGLSNNLNLTAFDDIADISSGIYVLRLTSDEVNLQKKLIKY